MVFKPSVAVYDACVLYPFHLRNLLVQFAADGLVEARWSEEIHDEWIRNLATDAATVSVERLHLTRDKMNRALPTATVADYQSHIRSIDLPDPDDRHIVAADVAAGASVIVTWNLRDFPVAILRKFGMKRLTPDAFLTNIAKARLEATITATANARRNLRRSRMSVAEFLQALERQKLVRFAGQIAGRSSEL
jgi:predicted nucleic acid-binding protein